MAMTEADAKTKWCPFVRCDGTNRHWGSDHEAAPISRCVGSRCMAWRWSNWKLGHDPSYKGGAMAAAFERENPLHGFCGLAGRPS
jgi:hypothetical protein